MFIIQHKKIFFSLSVFLVAASVVAVSVFGLQFGIEFSGGDIIEVRYQQERPAAEAVEQRLEQLDISGFSVRASEEDRFIVRTPNLSDEERGEVLAALSLGGEFSPTEERYNSVGPVVGSELQSKALIALAITAVAIVLFVAYVFRNVKQSNEEERQIDDGPSSWKYGFVAIIALLHDIIIPVGVFAALSQFTSASIDILFVMALLAILGFSVNDTIVVFDRVRERLRRNRENAERETFPRVVGQSLRQTLVRSINTSVTTLLVLAALFFLGPVTIQFFALTLMVGVVAGTYSSLCLAAPLLTVLAPREDRAPRTE